LTSQGEEEVGEIRRRLPRSSERIDKVIERLSVLVPGLRQQPLSVTAKVHFIAAATSHGTGRSALKRPPGRSVSPTGRRSTRSSGAESPVIELRRQPSDAATAQAGAGAA
jgi:hypothetical protein